MKNFTLILCLLLCCSSLAQDPQLFDDTWYLQKLKIDDIDIIPPNIENPASETTFDQTIPGFSTEYCFFYACEIIFDNLDSSFDIIDFTTFGSGCNHPDDVAFDIIYQDYFIDGSTLFNPFIYEITNTGGIRYLEFTNSNGDNAVYANQLLSIDNQDILFVTLYPNPAKDRLTLSFEATNTANVTIYNILGNKVMKTSITGSSSQLHIETLKAGVYLINVVAGDGQKQTLKFIKE